MAQNSLSQNINQAISDFKGVRQALIDKGVEIPLGTPTSQYGAKISEIQSGGAVPTKGYEITEWDSDGYPLNLKLHGMEQIPTRFFQSYSTSEGMFINLANVEGLEQVTSIGKFAFQYCSKLALTSLPAKITSIEQAIFGSCTNLALTSLPDGITSIGIYAFSSCTNLALTSLPDGVTSIGSYAFTSCKGLKTLSIGSAIKSISNNSFNLCSNLKTITINRKSGAISGAPWGASSASVSWVGTT